MSTSHKSLVSRVANSIRAIKKAWSEHTIGVLITSFASVFAIGWALHSAFLDFTGKIIVEKSTIAVPPHSERELAELKSETDALKKTLSDRDSSIAVLKEERSRLREELSAAHAERRNILAQNRKSDEAMKTEFPSLVARGLWDHGRPSPKSILNTRLLGEPLSAQAKAVLQAKSVSSSQKADLVEVVAQYAESAQRCAPTYSRLEATNRSRVIGSTQDENQYQKERAEAEAAVTECNQQANQLLNQVHAVLSQFQFTR